jgi:hypothetical protein
MLYTLIVVATTMAIKFPLPHPLLTKRHAQYSLYVRSSTQCFLFSGEGPRSRRYGRIAALRLLVQPCDEDDDDDDYFLSIS